MSTVLLIGCTNSEKETNIFIHKTVSISHEYSEIKNYELSWDQIFNPILENYYVYFYSTSCSHCVELKDFIIEKALKREDIFFVKSSNRDQFTDDPNKSIGAENPGEIWILGYPSMLRFENKKCTKSFAGSDKIQSELK